MTPVAGALLAFVVSLFRSRVSLQLEILALRHQLTVGQGSIRRPHIRSSDRILWSWLARVTELVALDFFTVPTVGFHRLSYFLGRALPSMHTRQPT